MDSDSIKPVPEELLKQLDSAKQQFHNAQVQREEEMAKPEYDRQEHINGPTAELKKAEKELEAIDEKIKAQLPPQG